MGVSAGSLLPLWDLVILVLLLIFSSYCFLFFLVSRTGLVMVVLVLVFLVLHCFLTAIVINCYCCLRFACHLGWWQQPAYRLNWTCPKGSSLQLGLIWSPRTFRTFQPHGLSTKPWLIFPRVLVAGYYQLIMVWSKKTAPPKHAGENQCFPNDVNLLFWVYRILGQSQVPAVTMYTCEDVVTVPDALVGWLCHGYDWVKVFLWHPIIVNNEFKQWVIQLLKFLCLLFQWIPYYFKVIGFNKAKEHHFEIMGNSLK